MKIRMSLLGMFLLIPVLSASFVAGQVQEDDKKEDLPFIVRDPKDLGIAIPTGGPVVPGRGRKALVKNHAGEETVGKIHVQVGGRSIMLMPNGRLISVLTKDAKETDQEFIPYTHDELIQELKKRHVPGFRTRKTRRYVYLYNTSEIFAKGTGAILEKMYPALLAYLKRAKIELKDPETPLAVLMFRNEKEYQAFRKMPPNVVAYYDVIANFIVMREPAELAGLAPDLAVRSAISTVAHEGVHQILFNVGVQQRLSRWPMWISEGLPEYFAATEVKRGMWKGVGQTNDMRMKNLIDYYKAK
ncbi:MAG: DUF1570 domain-containing protein, partial [Planctomycetales bacterium]